MQMVTANLSQAMRLPRWLLNISLSEVLAGLATLGLYEEDGSRDHIRSLMSGTGWPGRTLPGQVVVRRAYK